MSSCSKCVTTLICRHVKSRFSVCVLIVGILAVIQFVYSLIWLQNSFNSEIVALTPNTRTHRLLESAAASFKALVNTDASGEYRILKWIVKPRLKRAFKSLNISGGETTLVTQCSQDHFHLVLDLRQFWEGPISVSVFVTTPAEMAHLIKLIMKFDNCKPTIFDSVSVHVVMPVNVNVVNALSEEHIENTCSDLFELILVGKNSLNYNTAIPYPNNLLRNVALDGAMSDFTFVIDVDMLPSKQLFTKFRDFIRRESSSGSLGFNTAYVVPVFEARFNESVPSDRDELLRLWSRRAVQPFYKDVCWKCQRYTDYDAWRNLSCNASSNVGIGYYAEWHDPWEPFYIVPHFTARYDERFKQYGFNRISQSCELHIAGYQFAVLDSAFLVHRGFKNPTSFHDNKNSETDGNRILFRQFKSELKERYPYSKRRC